MCVNQQRECEEEAVVVWNLLPQADSSGSSPISDIAFTPHALAYFTKQALAIVRDLPKKSQVIG
jgi:hypothetical protein